MYMIVITIVIISQLTGKLNRIPLEKANSSKDADAKLQGLRCMNE